MIDFDHCSPPDLVERASLPELWEAARAIEAAGAYVVPNLYLTKAIDMAALPPPIAQKMRIVSAAMADSFRRALDHDLRIVFGTDSGVYRHGENAREFAERVALGQSPADAVRSATVLAAGLMRLDDRGRIAPGLRADLIAVSGDPLEDIRRLETVDFVMQAGAVRKAP